MAYKEIGSFKFWCQKVLPLVYDDSLSYYELLCKVVSYLNDVINNVNSLHDDFVVLNDSFNTLKNYVDNYFMNLNVQEEINNKLDSMVEDGSLDDILNKYFSLYVTPQMYGAKGDGVTDDTNAFRLAFLSGYNILIPLIKGEKYLITDTIDITNKNISVYGNLPTTNWSGYLNSNYNFGCVIFRSNSSDKALFNVHNTNCSFSNLNLLSDTDTYSGYAIKFIPPIENTHCDARIENCNFTRFDRALYLEGRGFHIENNLFAYNKIDVDYLLRNNTNWSIGDTDNVLQNCYKYQGRAFKFINNRHHFTGIDYMYIHDEPYVASGVTHRQTLKGAIISNNVSDLGSAQFLMNCDIDEMLFSNNVYFSMRQDYFFRSNNYSISNSVFANNTISGLYDLEYLADDIRCAKYLFYFNNITNVIFSNNIISNVKGCAISFNPNGTVKGLMVEGNVFNNCGFDETLGVNFRPCIVLNNCSYVSIINNFFNCDTTSNPTSIKAYNTSTSVWLDCTIVNNTLLYGKTSILPPNNDSSLRNNIQNNNL